MMPLHNLPLAVSSCLSFGGASAYSIHNDRVIIEIGEISNNQESGFLSGTLSIELWALPEAYRGDAFSGFPLAYTTIGELSSQHYLSNCRYDLNFQQPPQGEWIFTLMLREWNGQEYVTRDFVNFDLPYHQAARLEEQQKKANVVHLAFTSANEDVLQTKKTVEAKKTLQTKAAIETEKQFLHAPSFEEKVELVAPKKRNKKMQTRKKEAIGETKAESEFLKILNHSSLSELLAVKGIFQKLAEDIKAGQPYKQAKDLLKIKGIGKRKLDAISKTLGSKN